MADRGGGLCEHSSRHGDDVSAPCGAQRTCVATRKQSGWQFGLSTTGLGEADIRGLVRGVRLAFLAVASFAAATGWALGSPLPLIVALVIAGIDVVETSFMLLVLGGPTPRDPTP